MIPSERQAFNEQFTEEQYKAYIDELSNIYPGHLEFRIAETPVFIPKQFEQKMLACCDAILDTLTTKEYHQQSNRAIPPALHVPNENKYPQFIAFDFGVCINEEGAIVPKLIEMQAFPTLFAWHTIMPEVSQKLFNLPLSFTPYLNSYDKESYLALLKNILLKDVAAEEVILLEIFPHRQKTRVDFYATEDLLGIKPVCVTEIIKEGKKLYYLRDGIKTIIRRIYNRVIFDELLQQPKDVQDKASFYFEEVDVEWLPHPNWFYRYSKFSLPFLNHPLVPQTFFLNELKELPSDLEHYVLKPLFSFAGQGVIIDIKEQDIKQIKDPQNWILQRKVEYVPIVATPDGGAKVEIRLFYFWPDGAARPIAVNNLTRLSKGKMIGVRYNQDKTWVGGSFCLFQKE
jgi:hypothetical protein